MVGTVGLALVIKTSMAPFLPSSLRLWELLLPFLIYWGQRRALTEGIILTLFCSHLVSLSSGAPIGIFASVNFLVYLAARLVTLGLYAESWTTILALLSLFSLLLRVLIGTVNLLFGHPAFIDWWKFSWAQYWWVNALFGLALFYFLQLLDHLTFKGNQSEIEMSGDTL